MDKPGIDGINFNLLLSKARRQGFNNGYNIFLTELMSRERENNINLRELNQD